MAAEVVAKLCPVLVTGIEISAGSSNIITNIIYATDADKDASNPSSTRYGTCQCSAKVLTEDATNQSYTWSVVSGEATVSETGLVTLNENADDYYKEVNRDRVSVHDPAIVKDKDGTYYIFGSHLSWAKSNDLVNWSTFTNNINTDYETLFKNEFEWASAGDKVYDPSGNVWAPDVIWNDSMNKWCMYMNINGCSWNSCICLLTADSLSGNWTYVDPVVYSGFTESNVSGGIRSFEKTDYKEVTGNSTLDASFIRGLYSEKDNGTTCTATTWNKGYGAHAIDACVFYDEDGKLWFAYGSWSGGIYMFELDETNTLDSVSGTGYQTDEIAGTYEVLF